MEYISGDAFEESLARLPLLDRTRFQYPFVRACGTRLAYGQMPTMEDIQSIVESARETAREPTSSEDEWNSSVQQPLLKLALNTSRYSRTLKLHSV